MELLFADNTPLLGSMLAELALGNMWKGVLRVPASWGQASCVTHSPSCPSSSSNLGEEDPIQFRDSADNAISAFASVSVPTSEPAPQSTTEHTSEPITSKTETRSVQLPVVEAPRSSRLGRPPPKVPYAAEWTELFDGVKERGQSGSVASLIRHGVSRSFDGVLEDLEPSTNNPLSFSPSLSSAGHRVLSKQISNETTSKDHRSRDGSIPSGPINIVQQHSPSVSPSLSRSVSITRGRSSVTIIRDLSDLSSMEAASSTLATAGLTIQPSNRVLSMIVARDRRLRQFSSTNSRTSKLPSGNGSTSGKSEAPCLPSSSSASCLSQVIHHHDALSLPLELLPNPGLMQKDRTIRVTIGAVANEGDPQLSAHEAGSVGVSEAIRLSATSSPQLSMVHGKYSDSRGSSMLQRGPSPSPYSRPDSVFSPPWSHVEPTSYSHHSTASSLSPSHLTHSHVSQSHLSLADSVSRSQLSATHMLLSHPSPVHSSSGFLSPLSKSPRNSPTGLQSKSSEDLFSPTRPHSPEPGPQPQATSSRPPAPGHQSHTAQSTHTHDSSAQGSPSSGLSPPLESYSLRPFRDDSRTNAYLAHAHDPCAYPFSDTHSPLEPSSLNTIGEDSETNGVGSGLGGDGDGDDHLSPSLLRVSTTRAIGPTSGALSLVPKLKDMINGSDISSSCTGTSVYKGSFKDMAPGSIHMIESTPLSPRDSDDIFYMPMPDLGMAAQSGLGGSHQENSASRLLSALRSVAHSSDPLGYDASAASSTGAPTRVPLLRPGPVSSHNTASPSNSPHVTSSTSSLIPLAASLPHQSRGTGGTQSAAPGSLSRAFNGGVAAASASVRMGTLLEAETECRDGVGVGSIRTPAIPSVTSGCGKSGNSPGASCHQRQSLAASQLTTGVDDSDEYDGGSNYCDEGVEEDEEEEEVEEDAMEWHEVTAIPIRDPVTGDEATLILQSDITSRAELESHMAELTEAQLRMLENMFPRHVLEHMVAMQEPTSDLSALAISHTNITILFMDIVNFTAMSKEVTSQAVMGYLNELFTLIDELVDLCVATRPPVRPRSRCTECTALHSGVLRLDPLSDPVRGAQNVLRFTQALMQEIQRVGYPHTGLPTSVRVGIHTGSLVSGLIGTKMPKFSLWGDTMNTASRMESTSKPGCVQVSEATMKLLDAEQQHLFLPTGGVPGKGVMQTYLWLASVPTTLGVESSAAPVLESLAEGSTLALHSIPISPSQHNPPGWDSLSTLVSSEISIGKSVLFPESRSFNYLEDEASLQVQRVPPMALESITSSVQFISRKSRSTGHRNSSPLVELVSVFKRSVSTHQRSHGRTKSHEWAPQRASILRRRTTLAGTPALGATSPTCRQSPCLSTPELSEPESGSSEESVERDSTSAQNGTDSTRSADRRRSIAEARRSGSLSSSLRAANPAGQDTSCATRLGLGRSASSALRPDLGVSHPAAMPSLTHKDKCKDKGKDKGKISLPSPPIKQDSIRRKTLHLGQGAAQNVACHEQQLAPQVSAAGPSVHPLPSVSFKLGHAPTPGLSKPGSLPVHGGAHRSSMDFSAHRGRSMDLCRRAPYYATGARGRCSFESHPAGGQIKPLAATRQSGSARIDELESGGQSRYSPGNHSNHVVKLLSLMQPGLHGS
eukprot:gene23213-30429_t